MPSGRSTRGYGKSKVALDASGCFAQRYAAIVAYLCEQGTPIPTNDIWIAASAMQHGLKLITTDKHYLKLPQIIVECCSI